MEPPLEAVALPERFAGTGGGAGSGAAAKAEREWWRAFASPELDGLVTEALRANHGLGAARERVVQADAVMRQARAALIPTLDFGLQAEETRRRRGGAGAGAWRWETSYEADLWGRLRSARDAAALDREATVFDAQALELSVAAAVATAWVRWVSQEAQIDLLKNQRATNLQGLELLRLRNRRGQASAADVAQQEQLVESLNGEIELAEGRLEVFANALAVWCGRIPGTMGRPAKSVLPSPGPLPQTGVPGDWVVRRPDLQRALARVAAADKRLAVAVADQFPRVSVAGSLGESRSDWSGLFDDWALRLGANLAAPVVDGGRRRAEVERQEAVRREAVRSFANEVIEALAEVEDALVLDRRQERHLRSLEEQERLAAFALERARAGYLAGDETYLRVLDAVRSSQNLQRNVVAARQQWLELRVALFLALAGSLS